MGQKALVHSVLVRMGTGGVLRGRVNGTGVSAVTEVGRSRANVGGNRAD